MVVCSDSFHLLSGVVDERPTRVGEVAGSILGRVIPNTLQMVVMAALFGAFGNGVSIATD